MAPPRRLAITKGSNTGAQSESVLPFQTTYQRSFGTPVGAFALEKKGSVCLPAKKITPAPQAATLAIPEASNSSSGHGAFFAKRKEALFSATKPHRFPVRTPIPIKREDKSPLVVESQRFEMSWSIPARREEKPVPVIKPQPSEVISSIPAEKEEKLPPIIRSRRFEVDFSILKRIKKYIYLSDYSIPGSWPDYPDQRGDTCGLYALAAALAYGNPMVETPPARKNGQKDIVSLRQRAKTAGYTSFGEVFNVESLSNLANSFGFPDCTSSYATYMTKEHYIDLICQKLKLGGSVIAACDVGEGDNPANSKGMRTHWALIFGYFFSTTDCYFLVHQYGKKYIWSAESLYQSNLQLPILNPKRKPEFFYHKDKEKGLANFRQRMPGDKDIKNKRYAIGDTLARFRFGLCHVGSAVQIPSLDLTAAIEANQSNISLRRRRY